MIDLLSAAPHGKNVGLINFQMSFQSCNLDGKQFGFHWFNQNLLNLIE